MVHAMSDGKQPEPAPHLERWLSPVEAGELIGFSEWTITRAIREGALVAHRIKGRWRIAPSDLHEWRVRAFPSNNEPPPKRGRGRPKGSRNKPKGDAAKGDGATWQGPDDADDGATWQ